MTWSAYHEESYRVSSTGLKLPQATSQTDWDRDKVSNTEVWRCHVTTPFSMVKIAPCVKAKLPIDTDILVLQVEKTFIIL